MRGPDASGPLIAAADDDDMLAHRRNGAARGRLRLVIAGVAAVLLGEEIHGEMDSLQLPPGNLQFARPLGTTGEDQNVIIVPQPPHRPLDSDLPPGPDKPALLRTTPVAGKIV